MPSDAELFFKASQLHGQGRLMEAEALYRNVLAMTPHHAGALHRLGLLMIQSGRISEAEQSLRMAAEAAQGDALIRQHFGLLLLRLGKPREAMAEAEAALAIRTDFADAWTTLGAARLALGLPQEAIEALQKALTLSPQDGETLRQLGMAELMLGEGEAALENFDAALARAPKNIAARLGRAEALAELGLQSEALSACDRALALDPRYANAHAARGSVLKQLGRLSDAEACFRHAISLAPDAAAFHRALGELHRYEPGDARLDMLETLARKEPPLVDAQRVELHFALFKAYDDLGSYEAAYSHLTEGNRLYRARLPYDEAGVEAFFNDLTAGFPAEEVIEVSANPSEVAIFIVGMPRSGTSLVEQILASHPDVFGGGERSWMGNLISAGLPSYPQAVTVTEADALGRAYEAKLRKLAPQALRITDKLPANFRHLGLIAKALPKARIIHLQRDARDTCFSCYSKLFKSGLNFAYDLGELTRYYRRYEALMAHWRQVLPQERFFELRYETLVSDFENEARRLIDFCGLNWDPACLRFYDNKRAVRTLSELQVRKPLFSDSIGRWRHYEPWLSPHLTALTRDKKVAEQENPLRTMR